MNLPLEKKAELRVKHLELIQAVIARLANQNAVQKNYCITVVTAVCGFAVSLQHPIIALLSILPTITFAVLDARYLATERRFRALFNRVRGEDWDTMPSFELEQVHLPAADFCNVLLSWSVIEFYASLLVAGILVFLALGVVHGRFI